MNQDSRIFYDHIAGDYDSLMSEDSIANRITLYECMHKELAKHARVLDFGGGTGTDAIYLAQNNFKVSYMDNSNGMVLKAMDKVKKMNLTDRISFVDEDDIAHLGERHDGILANNCVLNSIEKIAAQFAQFSKLLESNGKVFFTLYDHKKLLAANKLKPKYLWAQLTNTPIVHYIQTEGTKHKTFVHRHQELLDAVEPHFELVHQEAILEKLNLFCLRKR